MEHLMMALFPRIFKPNNSHKKKLTAMSDKNSTNIYNKNVIELFLARVIFSTLKI
jgi:hypothetical protein